MESLFKKFQLAIRSFIKPRFKILAYHGVVDDHPSLYDVKREVFKDQMHLLRDEEFRVLSLDQAFERNYNGSLDEKTVVITFDDGFRNLVDGAIPLLLDSGFTATIFVVTGLTADGVDIVRTFEGRHEVMNWDELKSLKKGGFSIGSHSVSHCDLTALDEYELESEMRGSLSILTQKLGFDPYYFAYPYGLLSQKVRDSAERCGYKGALCFGSVLSSWIMTDPFVLKRQKILVTTGLKEFREIVDTSYDLKRSSVGLCKRVMNKFGRSRVKSN